MCLSYLSKDWMRSTSAGSEQAACTRLSFCLVLLECLPNTLLDLWFRYCGLSCVLRSKAFWFNKCFILVRPKHQDHNMTPFLRQHFPSVLWDLSHSLFCICCSC